MYITKKWFFTCLYRSPSQNPDEAEQFLYQHWSAFYHILHPIFSILKGNFNAKCSKWCASNKNNAASIELDNITIPSGYSQIIDEPSYYIDGSSSCIDLIFYSKTISLQKNTGLNSHFMKKVAITSFADLKILVYLILLIIIEKSRI